LKIFEPIESAKHTQHKSELYSMRFCATSNVRKFASKIAKARLVVCLSWSRQLLHSFPISSFRLCHQRSARGGACSRSYLQICCSLAGDP